MYCIVQFKLDVSKVHNRNSSTIDMITLSFDICIPDSNVCIKSKVILLPTNIKLIEPDRMSYEI